MVTLITVIFIHLRQLEVVEMIVHVEDLTDVLLILFISLGLQNLRILLYLPLLHLKLVVLALVLCPTLLVGVPSVFLHQKILYH